MELIIDAVIKKQNLLSKLYYIPLKNYIEYYFLMLDTHIIGAGLAHILGYYFSIHARKLGAFTQNYQEKGVKSKASG